MVQGAQGVVPLEMPAAVAEHAIVRMGGDHFGQEQIVALVIARLRQQSALQPGHTAFEQRCVDRRAVERLQVVGLELVPTLLPSQLQTRRRADGLHDIGLGRARHVQRERA